MGRLVRYFRGHPWERRMVTVAFALAVGAGAAAMVYPRFGEWLLVRDLGDEHPDDRMQAITRAVDFAARSPRFCTRLEEALDTDNDTKFGAIVTVLRHLGKFDTPARDPLVTDRMRALEIADTRLSGDTRRMILMRVLLSGRDNRYVRGALLAAANDESASMRGTAAVLGAGIGDDRTLKVLLADAAPSVIEAAALGAGIADRRKLVSDISELFETSNDVPVVSSAAYALALLDGRGQSGRICDRLRASGNASLRDRLLHVMTVLGDENAGIAVSEILTAPVKTGQFAPAAAIVAGDKLSLEATRPAAQAVAAAAARDRKDPLTSQVLASFNIRNWSFDGAANAFCRNKWNPSLSAMLIAAVRMMEGPAGASGGITREERIRTLRKAALWEWVPPTQSTNKPPVRVLTPVPSAVAAAVLWKLDGEVGEPYVRDVAGYDETPPGDYIAWELGWPGDERAFELGLVMLPPPADPNRSAESQPPRVYNENERCTGAMLLGIAGRTGEQIARATRRIRSRLSRGRVAGGRNFYVRGTYQCALLILGESEHRQPVRELLTTGDFPRRRAITALLAVGDRFALDWMLCNPQHTASDIAFLLINKGLTEVLTTCAPDLPIVDPSASEGVLEWQVRILQITYVIRRDAVELGLKRQSRPQR